MNILDGGDGVSSESCRGEKNNMWHKNAFANKTDEEMKLLHDKLSAKRKGEKNPMYGRNAYANKTEEEMKEINHKKSEACKKAYQLKTKEEREQMIEKTKEGLKKYFTNRTEEQIKEKTKKWRESYQKFLNDETRKEKYYEGRKQQALKLKGQKFYTNGKILKKFLPGTEPERIYISIF